MPAMTPENEAWYGPWPPVGPCADPVTPAGHDWGLGAGQPVPFPAEGERQTCVCGCARETEFGRLHYLVPPEYLP
jgi:hypothetical protein